MIHKSFTQKIFALLSAVGLAMNAHGETINCPGYLGTDLSDDTQVFSADSTWNTPIAADAEVDSNSALMMQQIRMRMENDLGKSPFLHFDYQKWSAPMFVIDAATAPKVDVYAAKGSFHQSVDPDRNAVVEQVPLPDCVWPDPKDDGHMILVDEHSQLVWEFSRFERGSPVQASRVAILHLNSTSVGVPFSGKSWWAQGVTGEGTSYLAGLVRRKAFRAGQINHALFVVVPQIRKQLSPDHRWAVAWPASRTDGKYYGPQFPLAGARLRLKPSLDLSTLSLSPDSLIVARALQNYGAIVSDQGDNFTIKAQVLDKSGNGAGWQDVNVDLSKIPLDAYEFLTPQEVEIKI